MSEKVYEAIGIFAKVLWVTTWLTVSLLGILFLVLQVCLEEDLSER